MKGFVFEKLKKKDAEIDKFTEVKNRKFYGKLAQFSAFFRQQKINSCRLIRIDAY